MADPDFISVRASSLAELFDCPARWEAKNLLNMKMPAVGAARLGTAIHASTSVCLCALASAFPSIRL